MTPATSDPWDLVEENVIGTGIQQQLIHSTRHRICWRGLRTLRRHNQQQKLEETDKYDHSWESSNCGQTCSQSQTRNLTKKNNNLFAIAQKWIPWRHLATIVGNRVCYPIFTRYPCKRPLGTGIWLAGYLLPNLIVKWSGIPDYLPNLCDTRHEIPEYLPDCLPNSRVP